MAAQTLSESQIQDIALHYVDARNAQLLIDRNTAEGAAVEGLDEQSDQLAARQARELGQLRSKRDQLAELGERYLDSRTSVEVVSTDKIGDDVVALVRENTELDYARIRGDEPSFTGFEVDRRFTFQDVEGTWKVTDVQLAQPAGMPPVNEVVKPGADLPSAGGSGAAHRGSSTLRTDRVVGDVRSKHAPAAGTAHGAESYGYQSMVDYAVEYYTNYNPDYRSYGGDGGDCTNFVSQVMRAGGWDFEGSGILDRDDNSKWYYGDYTWTTSYSWAGAENWYWFATDSGRTEILDGVWDLLTADVLQVDFDRDGTVDHSMVVTEVSDGEVYLTYHSNDTLNKSLSSILADNPDAWYYAHRT